LVECSCIRGRVSRTRRIFHKVGLTRLIVAGPPSCLFLECSPEPHAFLAEAGTVERDLDVFQLWVATIAADSGPAYREPGTYMIDDLCHTNPALGGLTSRLPDLLCAFRHNSIVLVLSLESPGMMFRNHLFHDEIHQERQDWQYGAVVLDSAYGAMRDNRYPYPLDQR
jgi:hypothetical protein